MKIGVLDDNQAILDYIEIVLTMDSHTVFRHTSSASLIDALFTTTRDEALPVYDLIILDLLLPGTLSGIDVFIRIRKNFTYDQLPIIVVTAVNGSTLEQFRQILPDDVPLLRKPFSPRALRQLVAQRAVPLH